MRIITAQGLTKTFPGPDGSPLHALGPLDLTIEAGQFVCIVGPSGCGKSTLLRLVAELDTPTAGQLHLRKTDRQDRPFNSLVFQGDSTFPWMTVHDNVGYGLQVRGQRRAAAQETIISDQLRMVGLTPFAEAYPYQLSGGMRQRVALARSLANDPVVLLMDEPFGALDEQNRVILQEELLDIWDRNQKTVLFVTHSIDEALVLGDRVLVMSAAPGVILDEITVPFDRPRQVFDLKRDPVFGQLSYRIWRTLRDEVARTRKP